MMNHQPLPELLEKLKAELAYTENELEEVSGLLHANPEIQRDAFAILDFQEREMKRLARNERGVLRNRLTKEHTRQLEILHDNVRKKEQHIQHLMRQLEKRHVLYHQLERYVRHLHFTSLGLREDVAKQTRRDLEKVRDQIWQAGPTFTVKSLRGWSIDALYEVSVRVCDELRVALTNPAKVNKAGGRKKVREYVKVLARKVKAMGSLVYHNQVQLDAAPVARKRRMTR